MQLGTATPFAVLGGTAVTDIPTSSITGSVGLSPAAGSSYAGLTQAEVTGSIYATDGSVVERFESDVVGRGMQYQAWEVERLVTEGTLSGEILPPSETVGIMGTLDEVRRQIGLRYPSE